MAASPLDLVLSFAVLAGLYGLLLALWLHGNAKVRRAAEGLGLQPAADDARMRPRYEGWLEGRPLRAHGAGTGLGRGRWLVLETECATPQGFTLVLGDRDVARGSGVPTRGLRPVRTGWRHFDGWSDARSNDGALAVAFLRRCRLALNAAPLRALWMHGGRAGAAESLHWLEPDGAERLARALGRRVADLEAVAADPWAREQAKLPDPTPEQYGPGEDEAPEEAPPQAPPAT